MPRFGLLNPHDQDPERAQLVQAYMVLHSQQTSVQRRLSVPPTSPSPPSSASSSPELSPARPAADAHATSPLGHSSRSSPSRSPRARATRSPFLRRPSVPSIPEAPEEREIDSDEEKLLDINKRIKATLTDLLNCESVKHDERMRLWVQTRLMDAQQTLNQKRRHTVAITAHRRSNSAWTYGWNPAYVRPASPLSSDSQEGESVRKLSI